MVTTSDNLVVIVGQTASGKSALAMEIARQHRSEILCADSRTVYRGMDIGTAKPSAEDQMEVPHHGLDLVNPNEYYSAAAFKRYGNNIIKKIHERGALPVMVGGTGLYIDGLVYDFSFGAEPDTAARLKYESMSLAELQSEALKMGVSTDSPDYANHRHLSRIVERGHVTPTRKPLPPNVLMLGIKVDQEQLKERIATRVDTMFTSGLEAEVQNVINVYGSDATGLLTPGYKAMTQYLAGEITLDEARVLFIRNDTYLAKRQLTWFKRNKDINWVSSEAEALDNVRAFLSRFDTIDT